MQKCQGSVTWTSISVMASSGVVKVACVVGVERGGKRGEIIRERGGRERKGVMWTFQPHFITILNVIEKHEFRVLK